MYTPPSYVAIEIFIDISKYYYWLYLKIVIIAASTMFFIQDAALDRSFPREGDTKRDETPVLQAQLLPPIFAPREKLGC